MTTRTYPGVLCALLVAFGAADVRAQTWQEIADSEAWKHYFTVLTMSGGAWGTATEPYVNRAIANAIANCKAMSGKELGCGAYLTSIRTGWSLGIRCGRETIVVADKDFAGAKQRAFQRETALRTEYGHDIPACVRVVTVDPTGRTILPSPQHRSPPAVLTAR